MLSKRSEKIGPSGLLVGRTVSRRLHNLTAVFAPRTDGPDCGPGSKDHGPLTDRFFDKPIIYSGPRLNYEVDDSRSDRLKDRRSEN